MHPSQPRLYLVRHCRTRYNEEHRVQGKLDIPLSEGGRQEARANCALLHGLGITRILSSPLLRAVETAQIYAASIDVPVETDPRLREIDHGAWEGDVIEELEANLVSAWHAWRVDPVGQPIPDGSETLEQAQARAVAAVQEAVARHPEDVLLLVMHMHIRAALLCALRGVGLDQFHAQSVRAVAPLPITEEELERILHAVASHRTP
jgi:broad specificity phosphatase PhoE